MGHTYCSLLVHVVFSTKGRRRLITQHLEERLWAYMGGIARENKFKCLAVGGVEDHVHLLLSLPATMAVSKAVQLVKGGSSKWVHDSFSEHRGFAWQEGYAAFSISISRADETIRYMAGQREHHRTNSFDEEFRAFLERHHIEYDQRFVVG